ncbi:MAG: protein kinase [Acidobacteriota bacterium]
MADERWQQVEEIFQRAVDLADEERERYLAEACDADESLRKRVEELLLADRNAGDFIETPALSELFAAGNTILLESPVDYVSSPIIGQRVGAYRIVREIGRGGMGAVYLAERADDAFRKSVAIKLIKRGMDTDFILRRFRNERQILANLDHPNIARLLDGGTTDDGLPFFVMEYIEGQPINHYSDTLRLSARQRLQLFQRVCAAVDYAHQNLVLHRDIKPGNILVTADGSPRLLDFGIAKVLNPDLADLIEPTVTALRLMTPEYASPEQVSGEQITAASDIYSLGVMLYELLTGHRPYNFPSRAPHEIARVICEETPAKPSMIFSRSLSIAQAGANTQPSIEIVSRDRSSSPMDLQRELEGDLDNIVMKALRKQPDRRYATVEDFSADIEKYLEGHPVSASSDFTFQRKEADTGDKATTVRALAVVPFRVMRVAAAGAEEDTGDRFLGVGLADALITRLSALRRIAVRPTGSVLKFASADADPMDVGKALAVDYVLDGHILKAGERIRVTVQLTSISDGSLAWAGQFDENYTDILTLQDSISAQVAHSIIPQLTSEEEERIAKRGTDSPEAYEAYMRGRYHWHTYTEEGLARAIVYFYEAISLDPLYALAYSGVADYHNWLGLFGVLPPDECFAAAKAMAAKAIELDPTLAEAYASLALAAWAYDWNAAESERLFQRAFDLNPNYAQAHEWRAHMLGSQGRHEEALKEMERARSLDPGSASLAAGFAMTLYNARLYGESLAELKRALDIDPNHFLALQGFGWVCPHLGLKEEALARSLKGVEVSGRAPMTLRAYAYALTMAGRSEEAREALRELEEISEKRFVLPCHIASIYVWLGERDKAFEWFDRAFEARDFWMLWLGVDPQFDSLRDDERFATLLTRIQKGAPETIPLAEKVSAEAAPIDPATNDSQKERRLSLRAVAIGAVLLFIAAIIGTLLFRSEPAPARSGLRRLTSNPGNDRYPQVSPDGKRIVFSSNRDGKPEIYVMSAEGGEPQRLTFNQQEDTAPAWSPDGRKIAFDHVLAPRAESDIYVMDADGGNRINLTNTPGYDTRPAWSPDGKRIAFASNRGASEFGKFDIYVMNADGSDLARLTDDTGFENDPAWSPDGKRIAFTRMTARGSFEIMVMNADGSDQKNITNHPSEDNGPQWSPDGRLIAFASSRDTTDSETRNIYVINADGSSPRRITAASAYNSEPSWMPDSRRLVFNTNRDGNYELYEIDIERSETDSESAEGAQKKSIAVLPFRTEGASENETSLGVGLADILTSKLGSIKQLSVRPAIAGQRYAGERAEKIGREMKVDNILSGELRIAGEQVQVSAQLLSAADGKILWAEKFDERLTDISTLQNSISERVLRALTLELTSVERQQLARLYTENSEAYQLYLVGRYHWGRRNPASINQAINYFRQAISKDQSFALAYAGLADCYALLNLYQIPPPPEAYAQAKENAARAIALDESLAEAHASLAYVKFYYDREWAEAEKEFRRALELNPSYATAHHWLALELAAMGRHDEAIEEIRRAENLDPRSSIIKAAIGMIYHYARRRDEALEACRRATEIDPGMVPAHRVARWIHQSAGDYDGAMAAYQKEYSFSGGGDEPGWKVIRAQIEALRDREEARALLKRALSIPNLTRGADFLTYEIAVAFALMGERDEALRWLARAEAIKAHSFNFAAVDPRLDTVRADARFENLASRLRQR